MAQQTPRAQLFARIPFELYAEISQHCDRAKTTIQAFTQEAVERHLRYLRRRERGKVVSIASELQKRQDQPGGSGPPPAGRRT